MKINFHENMNADREINEKVKNIRVNIVVYFLLDYFNRDTCFYI